MRKYASIFIILIACLCFPVNGSCAENSEYKLHPTDVITVTVYGQPELATKTRLASNGEVTLPLLGNVLAEGLTVHEFEQKVKALLEKSYLVNAQVVIFIDSYHTRQVSVMGEVNNPGKYDMRGEKEMTLMQAIAMAGGFTRHADITHLKVMRVDNGEKKSILINAKDITEKGNMDKDIVLKTDDIVFVPESFF